MKNGDNGIRTHDLLHAMQALSQLSYTPGCSRMITRSFRLVQNHYSIAVPKRKEKRKKKIAKKELTERIFML